MGDIKIQDARHLKLSKDRGGYPGFFVSSAGGGTDFPALSTCMFVGNDVK
ncbi:hypothetical protein LJC32_05520 [Oscillospiraceae bacterium OttesenSCG-928-F05]|nr:hypothetical protein [Oscillospiraceae bacterium OttesenSCG-928-F05]